MSISCADNEQAKIEPNNSQNNVRNLNESNSDISKTQSNTQIINNGQNGIWVNGQAKIMTTPDIVEMSLGIESINKIVSESVQNVSVDHEKLISILLRLSTMSCNSS